MKKKITLLFVFVLLVLTKTWGQSEVSTPQASTPIMHYSYLMHCSATDHVGNYINITGATVDGRNTVGTKLMFESTGTENQWYIKDVASKNYLVVANTNAGTLVTLSETASTYWLQSGTFFKANGVSNAYLNNNGSNTFLGVKNGNGGCSQWVLLETPAVQLFTASCTRGAYSYDATNGLSRSEATNDTKQQFAIVEFNGNKYLWNQAAKAFLNSNGMATDILSASPIYYDIQDDGTYRFYFSTSKNININGENNIVINDYSIPDDGNKMTLSAIADADMSLIESKIPQAVTITWNITGSANFTTTTLAKYGTTPVPPPVPSYISYTDTPDITSATENATYTLNTSYNEGFPFTGDKYYYLELKRDPTLKIYAQKDVTNEIKTVNKAKTKATDPYYQWRFEGDWHTGFRIYNKAAEKYISFGNTTNPGDKTKAYLTTNDEVGSYFEYVPNSDGNAHFRIAGTENNAYISNNGGVGTTYLTNWNSTYNLTDAGAWFVITEAPAKTVEDFNNVVTELNAKIAELAKISVLYSSADITTATNAIAAISCANNSEAENAIIAAYNAMETLYTSAVGKKFSLNSATNPDHYLTATPTILDARATELKASGVFQLEYSTLSGEYYVKGLKNNVYFKGPHTFNVAPNTSATATSLFFIGNANGTENNMYLTTSVSTNENTAIHYNSVYDNHTCGWKYNAGASQWVIKSVSDEVYEALCPWEDLENAIIAAESLIGTGFGKYTADETFYTSLENAKNIFTAHTADETTVENAIASIALSNLSLNMPANGTLLHIKDADNNYMTCNNTSGNRIEFSATKDVNTIFCYTGSALVAYTTGFYASRSSDFPCHMTGVTTESVDTQYHIHASPLTRGKYLISFGGDTRFMYKGANAGNFDGGPTTVNDVNYEFTLEDVESIPVSISAAGLATLYSPMALTIPEGVKAYVGDYNSENSTVVLNALEGVIPANTGVIIEGAEGSYDFNTTTTATTATSCLTGSVPAIATPATGVYTLQKVNTKLGLYKYTGTNLGAFKAYFQTSGGSNGFSLIVNDDDLTGVDSLTPNTSADNIYRDLQGSIVLYPQKNQIYILNGKKVLKQ